MYSGSLCRQYIQTWQSCAGIAEAAVHVDSMVAQESIENQLTHIWIIAMLNCYVNWPRPTCTCIVIMVNFSCFFIIKMFIFQKV